MAKIHQQHFTTNKETAHKVEVCMRVIGTSKAKLFEMLIVAAHKDVVACYPQKVAEVERELANAR